MHKTTSAHCFCYGHSNFYVGYTEKLLRMYQPVQMKTSCIYLLSTLSVLSLRSIIHKEKYLFPYKAAVPFSKVRLNMYFRTGSKVSEQPYNETRGFVQIITAAAIIIYTTNINPLIYVFIYIYIHSFTTLLSTCISFSSLSECLCHV